MSVLETEIRKLKLDLKKEMNDLRKIIVTRLITDKWVNQDVACALIGVKPCRLRQIRKHLDKNQKSTGFIGWKKGKGRSVSYYRPDIEKYIGEFQIMN